MFVSAKRRARWRQVGLPAIVLLGLLVRLPYLTERSLWFDEACSWRTARCPFPEMFDQIRQNVHPPLYYLLLKCWMAVAGDSVLALRSLSVLLGAATIVGMYLFAREVDRATMPAEGAERKFAFGGREQQSGSFALVVASLVAVSAFQVQASIEVKMYALGTALVSFSSWLLLWALRADRAAWPWIFYGVCAAALLYTHHYGLLSVTAQFAFLAVLVAVRAWHGQTARAREVFRSAAVVGVLIALAYVPWAWALHAQVKHVHRSYWIRSPSLDSVLRTFGDFLLPEQAGWCQTALVGLTVSTLVLLVLTWRRERASGLVLASAAGPMFLAALISFWTPIWYPRYFRFAHLFLLTALAIALWRIGAGRIRAVVTGLVVVHFLAATVAFWASLEIPQKPGMCGAMARIQAETPDADVLVVLSPYHYFLAQYYALPGLRVRLLQQEGPLPSDLPRALLGAEDLFSPEQLSSCLPRGVWIIAPSAYSDLGLAVEGCQASPLIHAEFPYSFLLPVYAAHYVRRQPQ